MLRRNVLIFHQAALGDFIVTWPLAMALSRIFPQSRIMYVTASEKGALAERVLGIESVDSELGWHALHIPPPEVPRLPERAMKLVEGAHTIVSFAAGKIDSLSQGLARVSTGAKIVSLDTKHSSGGHVTESLLAQLQDTPMLAEAMGQMLKSVASRGAGMMLKPSGRIVIHPGAGNEAKRWPAERFIELAERLAGEGRAVRIVLGEVELEKWPKELIDRAMVAGKGGEVRGGEVRVVTPDRLLDLLDEIAAADVFIGNDSGPGHLAGILGVSTISLYGGEGEHRWRPLGPRVRVLQTENLQTLTLEQVYDTLRETGSPP